MRSSANPLRRTFRSCFADDALSDDAIDGFPNPVMLPPPELGSLPEIDTTIRQASSSQQGRESLTKFLLAEDYVRKLVPLVEMAEDLEDLPDLHRLSNIMKMLILLNDTQIIELMVSDGIVLGVVGALECMCIPSLEDRKLKPSRRSRVPSPQGKSPTVPAKQIPV